MLPWALGAAEAPLEKERSQLCFLGLTALDPSPSPLPVCASRAVGTGRSPAGEAEGRYKALCLTRMRSLPVQELFMDKRDRLLWVPFPTVFYLFVFQLPLTSHSSSCPCSLLWVFFGGTLSTPWPSSPPQLGVRSWALLGSPSVAAASQMFSPGCCEEGGCSRASVSVLFARGSFVLVRAPSKVELL